MTARTPVKTPTQVSRNIPVPIRTTHSSAPYEAMAVSQQTHIDDLVQKNRTLDHVAKKLKDELLAEQARSKEAAKAIKAQWQTENAEWREGCESLQANHRIAHLRTIVELERERLAVVKEKDVTRLEAKARLQRDFRIVSFQAKESELERQIEKLEDTVEDLRAQREEDMNGLIMQHQQATEKLKLQHAELAKEVAQTSRELENVQNHYEKMEAKHAKVREEHAALSAKSASTTSELERTTLKLDGAQTTIAELQRHNDELKRNEAELKRQLDKWRNLETKGEAEVDTLRKRRVELEVQLKEIEGRLEDADNNEQAMAKALEKEKRKVEKLKNSIDPWRQEVDEMKELAEQNALEAGEAQKQLLKAERQIEKLKALLESERNKPSKVAKIVSAQTEDQDKSETEVEEPEVPDPPPAAKSTRPKSKSVRKVAPSDDESAVTKKTAPFRPTKESGRDDAEVQEASKSEKAKGKRKAREQSYSEEDEPQALKGRRKADTGGISTQAKPRSRGAGRSASAAIEPSKVKRAKPASKQVAVAEETEDADDDAVPKKKKRKINIFPPSQPTSFPWGQLPQVCIS
ncbi:hypothetical protein HWV62_31111 [Athelia sp. TMB]|nr:hypothetical protein HWV62_31111 [Athelia sp. TMB]